MKRNILAGILGRPGRGPVWRREFVLSRPVSRVLSWAIIHLGCVSPHTSSSLPESSASHTCGFLFGLAPGGVCRAMECCHPCGALLPHPFTLTPINEDRGGLLSAALSVGSRPPGVTWHLTLWSPDFPPLRKHSGDCLISSRAYFTINGVRIRDYDASH